MLRHCERTIYDPRPLMERAGRGGKKALSYKGIEALRNYCHCDTKRTSAAKRGL